MLFNSFSFFIFFAIIFNLYWKLPLRFKWVLLLVGSYWFYGSYKPAYLGLIVITTLVNFLAALLLYRHQARKRLILTLTLLFNFGLLFVFKYFDFFSLSFNQLIGNTSLGLTLPTLELLLPVGISFYTFQTVAYIIDVYRGRIKPETHLGYFALFVSFFPQLVAGPIERSQHLLPQLKKDNTFDYARVVSGLKLFGLGLFKKLVIADNLATTVNFVFGSLDEFKGLSLILTIILFSFQIYCDFSGYTDMARGIARTLGFKLVENFNIPYAATSVRDFWRRWHISLSSWLKDYLYIPLGGSRHGLWRTCLAYMVVFSLCGLWHGAGWNFVIWGVFHGVIISLERIIASLRLPIIPPKWLGILYTYTVVCVSWVFFRAESLSDAVYILRHSLTGISNIVDPGYIAASVSHIFVTNRLEMAIVAFCLIAILSIDIFKTRPSVIDSFYSQPTWVRWGFYTLIVLAMIHLRDSKINEFIYFRF